MYGFLRINQAQYVECVRCCPHLLGIERTESFSLFLYNILMPEYRRSKIAGGSFFFTVVTLNRFPILQWMVDECQPSQQVGLELIPAALNAKIEVKLVAEINKPA